MQFKILVFSALRNIKRNGKRSFLTMLGIIIGITSVITIVALGQGFKNRTIKEFTGEDEGSVILMATFTQEEYTEESMNMEFFNDKHKEAVEGIEGVESVEYQYTDDTYGQYMDLEIRGKVISGMVGKVEDFNVQHDAYGRNLNNEDNLISDRVVFLSEQSLKNSFDDMEELVGGIATINGISFEIVGIKKAPPEDQVAFIDLSGDIQIPEATYEKYFSSIKKISGLNITLNSNADVKAATKEIESKLNSIGENRVEGEYSIFDTSGVISLLGGVLNTITTFIAAVAGISLFIASIGLMNMMYTTVSERVKEIGIKRALGARKKDIRREFLVEGIVITMIGGLIGYILGILVAKVLGLLMELVVNPDLFTGLLAVAISIIIGLASSFVPANKAANSNTVDILK